MNTFERFLSLFLPRNAAAMHEFERRRFLLLIGIEVLNTSMSLLSMLTSLNNRRVLLTTLGLAVTHCLILFLVRTTGKLVLSVNLAVAAHMFVASARLATTGGVHSPSLWLLAVAPMVPLLIIGKRAAVAWLVVVVVVLSGFGFAESMGYQFAAQTADTITSATVRVLFAPVVVTGIALLFVFDREFAERRLHEEQEATQHKVDVAVEQLRCEQEIVRSKDEERLQESAQTKQYLESSITAILKEMNRLAVGDLTVCLQVTSNDDIGRLSRGFNDVVTQMRSAVSKVGKAVEETAHSTSEIAKQTEDIARSMREQAKQRREVMEAVEEMTSTIENNAHQASIAAEEADQARNDAEQGGVVVHQAIDGIQNIAVVVERATQTIMELGESNEAIGEIAKVIAEIADQTNLLALNAAIEAARAGDQGRGFAVVADEVRKLAERTSQATKEITATIHRIQQQTKNAVKEVSAGHSAVKQGQESAVKAQESLRSIIARTGRVSDTIALVASASEQQSATMREIARNIDYIATLAASSAATIQQTSQSLENLNLQAQNLRLLSNQFRVHEVAQQHHAIEQAGKHPAHHSSPRTRTANTAFSVLSTPRITHQLVASEQE